MKRSFYYIFFLVIMSLQALATHNRAGEITYVWLGGFTYEVTITTYTLESAPADRCELTINWGDNTSSVLQRQNGPQGSFCPPPIGMGQSLGNDAKLNIYKGIHTYQSPGFYTLSMQDLNRNGGITNVPFSINVPFFITTVINVNPALGTNSSPVLLNPPLDNGCVNRKFIHNPGAFDPDGDSLGYQLINVRGLNGVEILETYSPTLVQDPVSIDSVTGDFIWDTPKTIGQFNFAILITEYRKGPNGNWQIIGQVTRDMQIDIRNCSNQPPVIIPIGPFCVEAGTNLQFTVSATDPNNDQITLTATGGSLVAPPIAQFAQPTLGIGAVQQAFSWTPACVHVRSQPWYMYFKVQDNPSSPNEIPLVDFLPVAITVIAPAPLNPQAVPNIDAIDLSWDASICSNATGYNIYRREGYFGYIPDSCETGVPEYTGYQFIGSVNGHLNTTYIDQSNLKRGTQYCYMITAFFADGAESRASIEVCTELQKIVPIITNVDVLSTSDNNGQIQVVWIPPQDIDSVLFPPPYEYGLEYAIGINGSNFSQIATFNNLTDTSFTHIGLNTVETGHRYRVGFYSGQNRVLIGYSDAASSVYLNILPFDRQNRLSFDFNVPWVNESFVIYREQSPGNGIFDSIGMSLSPSFVDTGLVNGETYCYKVKAIGYYTGTDLPEPLLNRSQITCAEPIDTVGPCSPEVDYVADCAANTIVLSWQPAVGELCSPDITSYNLYYKATADAPWPATPLVSNIPPSQLNITITENSIVGCYAITAFDDATPPNEGQKSNVICIDGCTVIELPNVFTPNSSGSNNFFTPRRDANGNAIFNDIEWFNIQVFNRWGTLVWETEDADFFINTGWDGRDMNSGQNVAEGVYFYVFTYRPRTLTIQPERVIKGTVTIFR